MKRSTRILLIAAIIGGFLIPEVSSAQGWGGRRKAGLWDEARVFRSTNSFGTGIRAPQLTKAEFDGQENIMGDTLTYFKRKV